MRHTFGALLTCLAVMGASACGDATPPAAEGNVSVTLNGRQMAIFGPDGAPTDTGYGGTVLDGSNGVRLNCRVSQSGTAYNVQAHIENSEMSFDVAGGDIVGADAQMSFFMQGITASAESSVGPDNNPAPSCKVTTTPDPLVVKPGSIFAKFNCTNVRTPSDLRRIDSASGHFLFTGCSR